MSAMKSVKYMDWNWTWISIGCAAWVVAAFLLAAGWSYFQRWVRGDFDNKGDEKHDHVNGR